MKANNLTKLLIISHVIHYQWEDALYAYGPYTREIELWADLFPELIIASPLHHEAPPSDCIPFEHKNISIYPQPEFGGATIKDKLIQFMAIPKIAISLSKSMHKVDVIHVRCPGNLGLLGLILAPLYSKFRIAKYAGQWTDYPGEAFSTKLQKWLLKSVWWNAPVTIYGTWPNQPAHIIPFFTSIMSEDQMDAAQRIAATKSLNNPLNILYVGRLSRSKNVDVILVALNKLLKAGREFRCRIVGEGPELPSLKQLAHQLNIDDRVEFIGGLSFEDVLQDYEWADILVLASETEGWPKAITEAMAFGCVCIGSNRGLVPQILDQNRGMLVEPRDADQLFVAISQICQSESRYIDISKNAANWSKNYSAKMLQKALREIMIKQWGLNNNELLPIDESEMIN